MRNNLLKTKYEYLQKYLKKLGSAIIAFSGGVDSGLLAKVGFDILGEKVIAVTATSPTYPVDDYKQAKRIAKEIGIKHIVIKTYEFKDKKFIANPLRRCYWCKKELFFRMRRIADRYKVKYIIDGTNYDDRDDHRPGLEANKEFKIISPLYECQFSKSDVKLLAKHLGLSFWDNPSGTCLSSRIPFGEKITLARIKRIEKAEKILRDFVDKKTLLRARDHKDILRIELEQQRWIKFNKSVLDKMLRQLKKIKFNKSVLDKMLRQLKKLGYKYITLDLEGYIPAGKR
jgi:uncharacterized protein